MPVPTTSTMRIPRRLHRDEVYERLLEAISDGTLAPGERIRDRDLEVWLGVSRTPIRMALARLEDLSLVETTSQRATRVSPARPAFVAGLARTAVLVWSRVAPEVVQADAARRGRVVDAVRRAERAWVVGAATSSADAGPPDEEARVGSPTPAPAVEAFLSLGESIVSCSPSAVVPGVARHLGLLVQHHSATTTDSLDVTAAGAVVGPVADAVARVDADALTDAVERLATAFAPCGR